MIKNASWCENITYKYMPMSALVENSPLPSSDYVNLMPT